MTFDSGRFMEAQRGSFGFQIVLFGFAAAVAVLLWGRGRLRIALVTVAFYIIAVCANIQYIRYLYPVFPLATLVIAAAWTVPGAPRPVWWRAAILASTLAVIGLNVRYLPSAGWTLKDTDVRAVFNQSARELLLRRSVPERVLVSTVNDLAGADVRVGFIGAPYAAGLRGEAVHSNQYNLTFGREMRGARSTADVRRTFARHSVDYAIVSAGAGSAFPFLQRFLDSSTLPVSRVGGATLYRINAHR
jgi:hypothetical protein